MKKTELRTYVRKAMPYILVILSVFLLSIWIRNCSKKTKDNKEKDKIELPDSLRKQVEHNPYAEYNLEKCYKIAEDVVFFIFFQEGFNHKVYNDNPSNPKKGTWTIGPGLTSYSNGRLVKKDDPDMSIAEGEEEVVKFLKKHVFPAVCWVEKEMSSEEVIAICSFVYNVGMESFCHYHSDGTYAPKGYTSTLLKGLNNGADATQLARYLTGFRNLGGVRANGLLKRHWVEGAILTNALTIEDLMDLEPEKFYGKSVKYYFRKNNPDRDDFFTPDFTRKKIDNFKKHSYSEKQSLRCVLRS